MANPYRIDGPALVSFSGGRTSGYMLRHILDAHGGRMPDDVHVVFFNTGREFEQTLRFVHECGSRWNVPITWLEFDPAEPFNTAIVGYNSASRNGEPFAKVIRVRGFLPNPTMRLCTHYPSRSSAASPSCATSAATANGSTWSASAMTSPAGSPARRR